VQSSASSRPRPRGQLPRSAEPLQQGGDLHDPWDGLFITTKNGRIGSCSANASSCRPLSRAHHQHRCRRSRATAFRAPSAAQVRALACIARGLHGKPCHRCCRTTEWPRLLSSILSPSPPPGLSNGPSACRSHTSSRTATYSGGSDFTACRSRGATREPRTSTPLCSCGTAQS
jgi:hypothetical protein